MIKPKLTIAKNNVLLELHVPDFEVVKNFYKKLGFRVVWEREPEGKKGYLVMKLDDNILCFWPGNDEVWNQSYFRNFPRKSKRGYGVEIVIMVKDVDRVYQDIKSFAKIVDEIEIRPWGLKDFRIEDPFGYYLRITEVHNVLDPKKNAVK